MAVEEFITEGLTSNTLKAALAYIFMGKKGMTEVEWRRILRYVIPMQHNMENPITLIERTGGTANDTYIEYWIDDDDRLTQDSKGWTTVLEEDDKKKAYQTDECDKIARITVRFVGADAEAWAKLMHHITKREDVAQVFVEYCNATALEYVGSIRPINVDYFGVQNTSVAYDVIMMLRYIEVVKLPGDRLEMLSIAPGDIVIEG